MEKEGKREGKGRRTWEGVREGVARETLFEEKDFDAREEGGVGGGGVAAREHRCAGYFGVVFIQCRLLVRSCISPSGFVSSSSSSRVRRDKGLGIAYPPRLVSG